MAKKQITITTAKPTATGPRFEVTISGVGEAENCRHFAYLTYNSFRLLVILAVRAMQGDGWVDTDDLAGEDTGRYIYVLKKQLDNGHSCAIENCRTGQYRWDMKKVKVVITKQAQMELERFPDATVRGLSKVKQNEKVMKQ